MKEYILKIEKLKKYFPIRKGIFLKELGQVKAVDDVSFRIGKGTTYALVGESGSGKSTLARSIVKLLQPDSGRIVFNGVDIVGLSDKNFKDYRCKMQIVFQDPMNSLDPRCRIKDILKEAIFLLEAKLTSSKLTRRIEELLKMVDLPVLLKENFPHQLSGGQAQRVCIARALCGRPDLIVFDEPTSGLDVTTASRLLKLLLDLQNKLNITYLFISHDIKIVKKIANLVGVMIDGKIV